MKPMLAGKFVEEKVAKKLPLYGQIKYDGIRIFEMNGVASTRSLKAARSEQLQSFFGWNKDFLRGLDGEIICGDPHEKGCFQRTDSAVMSFNKPDEDMRFYVFDKWDETMTYEERLDLINGITSSFIHSNIVGSEHVKVIAAETKLLTTMEEVWEFYEEKAQEGHEGIILRRPDSYYKYGRGSPVQCECIKMKEGGWVDTEARIIAFHEQLHNANEATINALGNTERSGHKENLIAKNTLGSIEVEGHFEDGTPFQCRVGTGLDDETRKLVWENQEEYMKKLVKMKYFNVGIKDKPRFPTFICFRDPDDVDPQQLELLL